MFNKLSTRAAVAMMTARRGAGFVEWALLAVVGIAVMVALLNVLPGFFEGSVDQLTEVTDVN